MLQKIKLLFYTLPVLIAFILPFGNALSSPLIAIWFVLSLFCIKDLFQKANLTNKWFIGIIGFFVLTVISNYIFFNPNDPISSIEVKLSFLFFPFLFFLFDMNLNIAKRIVTGFVSGCLFASVICIGRAFMHFFQGDSTYFYYSKFTYFMHSAYFAMYLNLALIFVVLFYFKWFKANPAYKKFSFGLIGFFALCVLLCSSKIGIITLFVLVPLTVYLEYRTLFQTKHYMMAFGVLLILTTSVYLAIPQVFDRLRSIAVVTETNIDKTAIESSSVRVLIWGECKEIIQKNMITGVGVANANETLYAAYKEHGLTGAYEKKFNAHNQYFQTFIGMGMLGVLILVFLTIGLIVHALKTKNTLLLFFALLITVNFLVESMLQTSAGTVFYVFFLCFLLVFHKNKLTDETVS